MTRRYFPIPAVAILFCLCGAAVAKPSAPHHSQKAEDPNIHFIRQAYAYMDSGWDTLNGAVMMAYMTPDFQYTAMDGSVSGRSEYASLVSSLLRDKFVITDKDGCDFDAHSSIQSVAVSGQDIVIDRAMLVELQSGTSDPHLSSAAHLQVKYHDTWARYTSGWYMKAEAIRYVALKEHESYHNEIRTLRAVR